MAVLSSTIGMARKKPSNGRQVHPSGHVDTVDDWWKDEVRLEMEKREWTQQDLAQQLGLSPAAISNMFKPGPRQIRFKPKIHKLFGWPDATKQGEYARRMERGLHLVSLEDSERIVGLLESLTKKP